MTELRHIYKCTICGNIVEVLHSGKGQLVCCGRSMNLLVENTTAAAKEKHIPVVKFANGKVTVNVGSTEHPMEEKHYIEWIEVIAGNKVYRQFLNPGEKPEAVFNTDTEKITARAYCNLHGHWRS